MSELPKETEMNEKHTDPIAALRAFGEAYRRRPAPRKFSPEVVAAMRSFSNSLQQAAARASRAAAQIAESVEQMKATHDR